MTLVKYPPYLVVNISSNFTGTLKQGATGELRAILQTPLPATNFTYQWSKNGVNIAGATNETLHIENAKRADAAYYGVFVTDGTLWREDGMAIGVEDSMNLNITADSKLILDGNAGSRYTVEVSGDLKTWTTLQSVTASSSGSVEIPLAFLGTNRFYRAVLEP
jgi:hypothetical protein